MIKRLALAILWLVGGTLAFFLFPVALILGACWMAVWPIFGALWWIVTGKTNWLEAWEDASNALGL